jgi:predicted flap endonuclease-1-like 5' DNA nuclease
MRKGDAPAKGKVKAPKAPKVKAPKVRQVRQNQAATPRLKPKNSHADSPDDTATSLKGLTRIVSKLLESAGETTYPDILSAASSHVQPAESEAKNLRRRVYDILSVLASTGLVGRRGRGLVWNGYPDEGAIASLLLPRDPVLEREKAELLGRIKEKREQIRRAHEAGELLRGLAERNARLEASGAQLGPDEMAKVPLPFVLLACERGTEIAVETAENTWVSLFLLRVSFVELT